MKEYGLSLFIMAILIILLNFSQATSKANYRTVPVADTLVEEVIIPLENITPPKEGEEVFFIVEEMPKFRDGNLDEFRQFIAYNLMYPPKAAENGISGRVYVQFAVDKKGKVVDVVIVRGVHPLLDREAVRVVKMSPDWTPGYQKGKPVKVQFTFPITFSLTGPDLPEEE